MKKIVIILIVAGIVLPLLMFTTFEISTLSKNEKVIEKIYDNQLETIVFSVNQYADDIVGNWAENINWLLLFQSDYDDTIQSFLRSKNQIKSIHIFSEKGINKGFKVEGKSITDLQLLQKLISAKQTQLDKNKKYLSVNYRKNESLGFDITGESLYLAFWVGSSAETAQLCIIEIDALRFVREILATRIQATLENQFLIAVYKKNSSDSIIYRSNFDQKIPQFNFRKSLWFFPHYEMAVQIKEKTIESEVKQRTRNNILMFIIIEFLFILSAILIFRYSRKEMRLARIKSEFISNVSHEIRTPLALISMYIETLDMGRITAQEKVKEYYKVILQETNRLSGIVNNILNFSKLESGKIIFKLEPLSANDLVDEVLGTYSFHLKNKGFRLIVEKSEQSSIIYADKRLMCDVLVNLLDNAVKYSYEFKEIKIKTIIDQNKVIIEISDKGIGISKEDQKLIFDQFFRVTKGNLAHQAMGTGLGLSIVKNIIEAHKAKIHVISEVGLGSCFRIEFMKY